MNDGRRLAVRIPVLGWEADISAEGCQRINARILNISIDGLYLMTRHEFQPGSTIAMLVKSSKFYFSATAMIVRKDSHGVGISFLDLNGFSRDLILNMVSRFFSERMSKLSWMTEY